MVLDGLYEYDVGDLRRSVRADVIYQLCVRRQIAFIIEASQAAAAADQVFHLSETQQRRGSVRSTGNEP